MENEKRLIDANALMDAFRNYMVEQYDREKCVSEENCKTCENLCLWRRIVSVAPTVDAVVLPCKIGDDVYIIPSKANFDLNVLSGLEKNNRVYHQKVAKIVFVQDCWYVMGNADWEYGTGRILLDRFYKETWFLTKEEAEAALAKMDGE